VEEERQGGGATSIEEVGPEVGSFVLGSLPDTIEFGTNFLLPTTAGQEHKGAAGDAAEDKSNALSLSFSDSNDNGGSTEPSYYDNSKPLL
jgi:hypothetical protein